MFNVNNRNAKTKYENMFKVNNKDTRTMLGEYSVLFWA